MVIDLPPVSIPTILGACVFFGGIGLWWWRLATQVADLKNEIKANVKSLGDLSIDQAKLGILLERTTDRLQDYKLQVAKEYASQDALAKSEHRINNILAEIRSELKRLTDKLLDAK